MGGGGGGGSVKFLLICKTDECHLRSSRASDRTTHELTEQKLQLSASCHGQGLLVLFEGERGAIRKNKARHLSSTIAAGAFRAAQHIYQCGTWNGERREGQDEEEQPVRSKTWQMLGSSLHVLSSIGENRADWRGKRKRKSLPATQMQEDRSGCVRHRCSKNSGPLSLLLCTGRLVGTILRTCLPTMLGRYPLCLEGLFPAWKYCLK